MKYIVAVIKPQMLDPVRDALTGLGVAGMTVSEVKGFGRQNGHSEVYRGAEYSVDFLPKLKLEIATDENLAPKIAQAIRTAGRTGKIGDGKIFIFDLEEVIRVRTGETGADAL